MSDEEFRRAEEKFDEVVNKVRASRGSSESVPLTSRRAGA
jgi:hypothetical protein